MQKKRVTAAAAWQYAKELVSRNGMEATPEAIARALVYATPISPFNPQREIDLLAGRACDDWDLAGYELTEDLKRAYLDKVTTYTHGLYSAIAKATAETRKTVVTIEKEAAEEKAKITAVGLDADLMIKAIEAYSHKQKSNLKPLLVEQTKTAIEAYKAGTISPLDTKEGRLYCLALLAKSYREAQQTRRFSAVELPVLDCIQVKDISDSHLKE